jgi:ubiquinone/menaquinone biosynthesis C-methylase UbiE
VADEPDLAPPAVAASLYDEEYYREVCAGSASFSTDSLDPTYEWALRLARFAPGSVLVDVGCGRGELLVAAARAGASRAVGVEYSAAALRLAAATVDDAGVGDVATVVEADARRLPVDSGSADLVTFLDVVEHLTPDELATALLEARRVLKPGGRVFIHTMPNRNVFTVAYPLVRALKPWRLVTWPADPRTEHERLMHVNEQTAESLRDALDAAGFASVHVQHGGWVRDDAIPSRLYASLAKRPRSRWFAAGDLWAEATR